MPFAPDSNVEILNTWGTDDTFLTKRTRTTKSGAPGKARYTIEVKSEPLLVNFDETMLGAGPADAIKEVIRAQIVGITERVSLGTVAMRERAMIAFMKGEQWAMKRYSGGRTGSKPPKPDKPFMFNDSGRLVEGLAVMQNKTDATFTINVPANRLDPSTFKNTGDFVAMVDKLKRLVPALDPRKLGSYRDVENAVRDSIRDMVIKAENLHQLKLKQLAIARKKALIAAGRFVFQGVTGRI